jgi:drug/metabolite transporter (DMT)-like permease
MRLSHRAAVALMVLAPLLWSTAGVVTKRLDAAQSFEVTFWRSFFTAVSLLALLPLTQGRQWASRVQWRSGALWVSSVCWSIMFSAFMIAMVLTTVANVLITLAAGPLLTALVSRIVTQHQLPTRTYAAIGVAAFGIGYMFWSQFAVGKPTDIAGCLIALLVPVCASIMWTNTQVQQSLASSGTPADAALQAPLDLVPSVLLGAVISAITMLPFALPMQATLHDVAWLGFLGLFQLAIPCSIAIICARVLKGAEVALLALLEIVFGITWAWLFIGEVPTHQVLTGGALVVGALIANVLLGLKDESH